jgi:hypothetical protein
MVNCEEKRAIERKAAVLKPFLFLGLISWEQYLSELRKEKQAWLE